MILAHLTDLHVRPPGLPAYRVVESTVLTERAFRAVASFRPRPDAIVISGDVTDCGLAAEYEVLAGLLRVHFSDFPVYVIPGNHDRRENFRAGLGHMPGVVNDPQFVQYAIDDLPVRLVLLDTVVPGHGHGELCQSRLDWLDATLAAATNRPTMLVMHHPPMLCGIALLDSINLHAAERLAGIVARHRQVERILCGHHHRTMTGRLGDVIVSVAPSVAHQGELDLVSDQARFVLEPPRFQVHVRTRDGQIATHTAFVEPYPGPFPYVEDPDYPGAAR